MHKPGVVMSRLPLHQPHQHEPQNFNTAPKPGETGTKSGTNTYIYTPAPNMSASAPSAVRHNVNFITGNANKLREVKAILEPAIQVDSQALDLIEIQGTLEEVTLDKCRRAADLVNSPQTSLAEKN